jgi:hypothetical protein
MLGRMQGSASGIRKGEIAQQGWMLKRGEYTKPTFFGGSWKKRYFVLKDLCLDYYADRGCNDHKGSVDISNCSQVRESTSETAERLELELVTAERTYRLRCLKSSEFEAWIEALAQHVAAAQPATWSAAESQLGVGARLPPSTTTSWTEVSAPLVPVWVEGECGYLKELGVPGSSTAEAAVTHFGKLVIISDELRQNAPKDYGWPFEKKEEVTVVLQGRRMFEWRKTGRGGAGMRALLKGEKHFLCEVRHRRVPFCPLFLVSCNVVMQVVDARQQRKTHAIHVICSDKAVRIFVADSQESATEWLVAMMAGIAGTKPIVCAH